ncbi:YoaK family protein [Acetobacter fabarum]|uniref:YoaK family protein n=1 Tax=Acetobacter fabarum TaxID=483199 RepID=UPI00312B340A
MLFQEQEKRNFVTNRRLGSSLAMIAGAINVAGFMDFGYYCANMTGNASAMALNLQNGKLQEGFRAMELGGSFVLGAIVCTFLVNRGRRRHWYAAYAFSILLESAMLALLGLANVFMLFGPHSVMSASMLCFLMGLQNATVTRISGSVVRTTHITGMLTDLGMEIADWLDAWWHRVGPEHRYTIWQQLWLHLQIICCFVGGGVIGAFVYHAWPTYFLFVTAALLVSCVLPGMVANTVTVFAKKRI